MKSDSKPRPLHTKQFWIHSNYRLSNSDKIMAEILFGVLIFTLVVLTLVSIILLAKSFLVASGDVKIMVNGQKEIVVPALSLIHI